MIINKKKICCKRPQQLHCTRTVHKNSHSVKITERNKKNLNDCRPCCNKATKHRKYESEAASVNWILCILYLCQSVNVNKRKHCVVINGHPNDTLTLSEWKWNNKKVLQRHKKKQNNLLRNFIHKNASENRFVHMA